MLRILHFARGAFGLGQRDQAPVALLRQLFEGREVLHRVRVAEEDQRAFAVRVAVEALVRVGAADPDQAAVVEGARAIGRGPAAGSAARRRRAAAGWAVRRSAAAPLTSESGAVSRVGCRSVSRTPAQTPIAMQATPIARARFGRRASTLREADRVLDPGGGSTTVGIQEAATTARPAATDSGPQIAAAKISAGQCQRYQE